MSKIFKGPCGVFPRNYISAIMDADTGSETHLCSSFGGPVDSNVNEDNLQKWQAAVEQCYEPEECEVCPVQEALGRLSINHS